MTTIMLFFVVGFLSLELFILFLFFYPSTFEFIYRRKLYQWIAFLLTHVLFLGILLFGGYADVRWKSYRSLRYLIHSYKALPEISKIEISGDPRLTSWVHNQQIRRRVPPNYSDILAFYRWQKSLRETLRKDVFELPDRFFPANINVHKISAKSYQNIERTFLTYESFDGTTIPAYLFIPHTPDTKPAIIVLHGHVPEGGDSGISQMAGLVKSYQHGAAFALARAGFVILSLELRGFGYLGTSINTEHRLIAYNAMLGGSFYRAILAKDIKYALDLLRSLKGVDSQRIGITGASYGGLMAVTYAALDESIKAVVFQSYGGYTGPHHGVVGTASDQPHYCTFIPSHNVSLFQEDLFLLIAPRPLLGVRGKQDFFGDDTFSKTIGEAYAFLNTPSLFRFEVIPGSHEYFIKPAVKFFQQHL